MNRTLVALLSAYLPFVALASDETYIMGTLPGGATTNLSKVIDVPEFSELRVNVYAFGKSKDAEQRLNSLDPGSLDIVYTKAGFTVYEGPFRDSIPRLIGPCQVRIFWPYQPGIWPDLRITEGSGFQISLECVPSVYPPNKAVVIPAGSLGAEVSLESSYDLKRWAPAALGTYTTPTNNLFFRLRVERVP